MVPMGCLLETQDQLEGALVQMAASCIAWADFPFFLFLLRTRIRHCQAQEAPAFVILTSFDIHYNDFFVNLQNPFSFVLCLVSQLNRLKIRIPILLIVMLLLFPLL